MMDIDSNWVVPSSVDAPANENLYPNRPLNHSETLPFHDLFLTLFNPLNENKKKPTGPNIGRKKLGPHGPSKLSPHEFRQNVIERFISRWRKEVGDDIYPAFRLILPEKDRERTMYGLKEKSIGKLLIKVMKISKDSEDGYNLLNWKQPGQSASSRMAGDFAGRCFEVISKRPMRTDVGTLSISNVNEQLDQLAAAQREETQLPILEEFYNNMNADELMWVIRIILRQMKVGATEKTFFNIWHPDADNLYNISSNLRRVCWELHDRSVRLEDDDRAVTLMQCFQPQLAQFQIPSFSKMIEKMRLTEEDPVFWIEEKLDGERMQLHMVTDESIAGNKRFGFWSRKAKDYTYLYGNGFMDGNGALTRHIQNAFHHGVKNIILDGEMITWDPEEDAMVPFGTLKTAALTLQKDQNSKGHRPLYRAFDILYLNGKALSQYMLRDRRKALEASVVTVSRWLEVHPFVEARSVSDIDTALRKVVQEGSEGLVLKNPRSPYQLNERNDDWMKVKPEYMTEFGESLDCIVIGGYYGSGTRGGRLSSFLCGLKVDENDVKNGANPMKCWSFFKVGGGFTAADYANIRHQTDGKWKDWNLHRPPTEYIELAGGAKQHERPDVWIKPDESVVISVKAASVHDTDQFRTSYTLRFPRFKQLRADRDWHSALTISGFEELRKTAEKEKAVKQFEVDNSRKKASRISRKKPFIIAGDSNVTLKAPYGGPATNAFKGLNFYVLSESLRPENKSKNEIEGLIKSNGGNVFQRHDAKPTMICVGDRKTVKVASLIKRGECDIVRPSWIFACLRQSEFDIGRTNFILPFEPRFSNVEYGSFWCVRLIQGRYMLFTANQSRERIEANVDDSGDSYARDLDVAELKEIFNSMQGNFQNEFNATQFEAELEEHGNELGELPGWLFKGLRLYVYRDSFEKSNGEPSTGQLKFETAASLRIIQACNRARFAGAHIIDQLTDESITHVLIENNKAPRALREVVSQRKRLPRIVTLDWVEQSWEAKTLLDEERFAPY